ncbi:replication initiation protein, partial [Clostridium estertheticum]
MDKNYIVTKSNNLINCNYDLSLQEQKIILTLASMVQPQDENFKPYIFKIKDFMKLLGIDNKSKYTEIPKITKELMQKVFEIKKGNKVTQLAWLSSAEYEKGTGMVELEFSPKLKPYMLGLKEFYTSYKLDNVLSLKSKYSVRLYEILKSNLYRKYIEIEVEEFKNMVGSKEKAYNIYNNFKNRILIRAQKELIEKTDIKFDFEEIKTGRKVTSIKFIITSNKVSNEIAASLEKINPKLQQNMDDINRIKEIINEPIKDIDALKLFEIAKGDINIIKEKYS